MAKPDKKKNQKAPPKKPVRERQQHWLYLLLLFGFTFLLYFNSINHDYALDDDIVTRLNKYVQKGIAGIPDIFSHGMLKGFNNINDRLSPYRPLALMNLAIEKQLFGNNPVAHHFFNVLWFAVTAIVLFLFLVKIFPRANVLFSFIITLLFVAHPIHTEVIANIKSRDELLGFLFGILSFSLLISYLRNKHTKILLLALFCYLLSLLSKESSLSLIAVVPLLLYFFTEVKLPQLIKMTFAYGGVGLLSLLIRYAVEDPVVTNENMEIINNTLAAAPDLSHRYATITEIMGKYMQLLVFPVTLSADYSYAQIPIVGWMDWRAFVPLIIILAMIVTTVFLFSKKDPLAFCILFFFITIAMVSNVFMIIGATMAERFLFTPSLAICIAIPAVVGVFSNNLLVKKTPTGAGKTDAKFISWNSSKTFLIISGVILILFSFKTISRNNDWKNNFTLFSAGIKNVPNSASAHASYASELRRQGEESMNLEEKRKLLYESIVEYRNALKIYPKYAEANYNMGVSFWNLGNIDSAVAAYRRTVAINPNYQNAWNNLGVYYINKAKYDSAIILYNKLIEKNPNFSEAYANIGAAYHNLGNYEKALYYYQKALALDPGNVNVRNNLQRISGGKVQ